jgi:hypothetical protein
MARNPFHEAISWIDGVNELGKPRWYHESWEHADDFVIEWRFLTPEEQHEMFEKYKEVQNKTS